MTHLPQDVSHDRRIEPSNTTLWEELRYIRRKVDSLETKVLMMFGGVSAISAAIAIFEILRKN